MEGLFMNIFMASCREIAIAKCKVYINQRMSECRGLLLLPMQHPKKAHINFQSCVFVPKNIVNKILKPA